MPNSSWTGEGQAFESDGVRIAYDDVGSGPPVVLIHGFASTRTTNWRGPGWYEVLVEAGRRVVALDCRGHGESGIPADGTANGPDVMAEDVVRLMDHLGIDEADVVGYSMGSRVALQLLVDHPGRANAVVLGGIGTAIVEGPPAREEIAAALEASDVGAVSHPAGRRFRAFAEKGDGDLEALAAVMRSITSFDIERLGTASTPVLVVAGEDDAMVGDAEALADAIPGADLVTVPERNHMTTVGDERFKAAVVDFLDEIGLASDQSTD